MNRVTEMNPIQSEDMLVKSYESLSFKLWNKEIWNHQSFSVELTVFALMFVLMIHV